ncbi:hypothetical protein I5M32_15550 [Pedobacter sp. SD-b]|uniref:Uncharacterized protein n=1 Tax=Pedobacter segetis TaxID=2793069 RepID=A0ABS1BNB4_9SPHI|nr:hypothetical protein [Pedobacter segetis]MBK0384382.1 hypothetical protein [Pedobacter segetis]
MIKPPKQNSASTTGLLLGLLFGFLIGLAMFKQTPKSERSVAFPYLIGAGLIISTVCGYKIGALNDAENYRDESLGIKRIETRHLSKAGEWSIESTWVQFDGFENKLITTTLDGETVSIYNQVIIANHGNYSNNRSATKIHEETKNDLIQKLKDSFKNTG